MVARRHWTDADVVNMAILYLSGEDNTVTAVEQELGVSDATVWWCIKNRLKYIDGGLYLQCIYRLSKHRGYRGGRV